MNRKGGRGHSTKDCIGALDLSRREGLEAERQWLKNGCFVSLLTNTVCPTRYRTRHFLNNSNTNEDIATKFEQEYVRCVRNEEECVCTAPNFCDTGQRCGMSRRHIIGPIFFDATIRTAAYIEIFNTFVICWTMRNSQLDISSSMERHPALHTSAWPKFSPFSATASFRRDFGHPARRLIISYGDIWKGEFTKTSHEPQTPWKQTSPKKFRQWQRTYWQTLSKIWRAGFSSVWTQIVATYSKCYDVVTFLTQWGKSFSNFVTISSLVVKLLKKCRVR